MNLFKSFKTDRAVQHFNQYFSKVQAKGHPKPLQIKVFSQKLGLDFDFPSNSTNQPFHVASIGKLFTATLVQRLVEKGAFSLDDSIRIFLPETELDRLFVYQGIDYSKQVTIEHLLGHTSGIADYFEGKASSGRSFVDDVLSNPTHHWTPLQLVEFTRVNQTAVSFPGKIFNYSDTGYILLGLLVERATGKTFNQNLEDEFFRPLDMRDSYLMFYGAPANTPKKEIETIWLNHVEISRFESLSCDWSGGGIITTTADLLRFSQALRSGQLLQTRTLESMDVCRHKFRPGIYYGLGMMEIRFKEFFFLLRHLPKVKGHIGILATHLFYDSSKDAHIIMNFGSNTRMVESFKALIDIENVLQRCEQPI